MEEITAMSLDDAMELARQVLLGLRETYKDYTYNKGTGLYTSRSVKVVEGLERTISQVNIQLGFKRRGLTPKRREELKQLQYYDGIESRVGPTEYPYVRFAIPYNVKERRV